MINLSLEVGIHMQASPSFSSNAPTQCKPHDNKTPPPSSRNKNVSLVEAWIPFFRCWKEVLNPRGNRFIPREQNEVRKSEILKTFKFHSIKVPEQQSLIAKFLQTLSTDTHKKKRQLGCQHVQESILSPLRDIRFNSIIGNNFQIAATTWAAAEWQNYFFNILRDQDQD